MQRIRAANQYLTCLGLAAIVAGCGSPESDAAKIGPDKSLGHLREKPNDTIRPVGANNVALSLADNSSTHYSDGSPVYLADGSLIDYRPRNLSRRISQLPTLYLTYESNEQVILPGSMPNPRVDPKTRQICWRAFECHNANCSNRVSNEQPNLYVRAVPGVRVGPQGKALPPPDVSASDGDGVNSSVLATKPPNVCTVCNRATGKPYVLPESQRLRAELLAELDSVRSEEKDLK